jgi:ligand-binding SRPBCC domain-containing protein
VHYIYNILTFYIIHDKILKQDTFLDHRVMKRFVHRFRVRASLEKVAAFHRDASVLKLLTPPPVWVKINEVQSLAENSRVDFTMWMGPVPVRWVAVHSEVDQQKGFTDKQALGPFETWIHRHSFCSLEENITEVVDEIQARPGKHPFWGLVSRLMWISLPLLFAYRGWVTRRMLERRDR